MNLKSHFQIRITLFFLLLYSVCVYSSRADVSVDVRARDGIPSEEDSYGVVNYNTSQGLVDTRMDNGAGITYSPDASPGHEYFSADVVTSVGSRAIGTADTVTGAINSYAAVAAYAGLNARIATTTIRIDDVVTFTNSSSQAVPITVHWHVDGTLTPGNVPVDVTTSAEHHSHFVFGPWTVFSDGKRSSNSAENSETSSTSGWNSAGSSYQIDPNGGGLSGISFTGHTMLPPGQSTWGITNYIATQASAGSTANFSNTAGVTFELPTTVSFTSSSGMLLSHGRRSDFNRDSFPDYVLFSPGSRRSAIWYLQSNAVHNGGYGPILPTGWRIAYVADMDMDGKPDYLLFNPTTRSTAIWYLNDSILTRGALGPPLPNGWSLIGAADFNDDLEPDYLLFNAASRRTAVWYLHGSSFMGEANGPVLPAGWTLSDVNDFNGDDKPDLVLFNASAHRLAIWYLDGVTHTGSAYAPVLPAGWTLQGSTDFNRDGKADFVLLNASTRQTALWYLNGVTLIRGVFGPTLAAGWEFVAP